MVYDIVACIEVKFPWKLTISNFTAQFANLESAEKTGREAGRGKKIYN